MAGRATRLAASLVLLMAAAHAAALEWPQQIEAEEGTIVVYQPQPESLEGNVLKGRAAMSVQLENQDEPIFGAFWFDTRIDTDRDAGTATLHDMRVTNVRWPESKDAAEQRFTAVVEAHIPETGFEISLERLSASLEAADLVRRSLADLKSDPPRIEFSDDLAVLLLYDGEPRFSAIEGSHYERALNTPFLVVRDQRTGAAYLSSGHYWYQADGPLGPWRETDSPPADLVQMVPEPDQQGPAPATAPDIVVATQPTELVATAGPPDWQSLPGGEVLYVRNTETAWLRELSSGNMYLLLSGRWYRSRSEQGPWTFVPADELPASFQAIPPDSEIGGVRVSVAGTQEAEDALLDAQIPQTAAIRRDQASLTVEYDGEPQFVSVDGADVSYAVNTGAQVLEVDGRYYAVDDGVWFTAGSATGPWTVADTIPQDEIAKIPPSAPVYNTTYVHIYDSTPEVVYVGYTPGYLWSFPYYGVPVYGTGWYYPPYWGSFYYPRPYTWGFHVGYNPWTGWNFGVSWSNGFFTFGASWGGGWGGAYRPWGCCGGWYGGGYRPPVIINRGDINIDRGDINIGNSINVGNRAEIGNRIARNEGNLDLNRGNLYNRAENRTRNAAPALTRENLNAARPALNRPNDVFTDRNGNVARRVGNEWQTRESGAWRNNAALSEGLGTSTRQAAQNRAGSGAGTRDFRGFDRQSLDRSNMARQHGFSREQMRGRVGGGYRGRR